MNINTPQNSGLIIRYSELNVSPILFEDISTIFLIDQENNARPYSINVIKEFFNGDAVFLKAEYRGQIVGYITADIVYEDADIVNIVVIDKLRNSGIGKRLMQDAMEQCFERGAKRILLEVNETNLPAIKLYRKLGFKMISIREKYYGDNSALIMQYTPSEDSALS